MPVFGTPPARISNLVVDDDLDMSGYSLTLDNLEVLTNLFADILTDNGSGYVSILSPARIESIEGIVAGTGICIENLIADGKKAYLNEGLTVDRHTLEAGPISLYTDSAEVKPVADAWLKLKEVVIPPEYRAVSARVEWEGKKQVLNGYPNYYQVRVNDVVVGALKDMSSETYAAFSDDIDFPDAEELKLQIWGYDAGGAYMVYLRNMEVLGTDTIDTQYIGGLSEWPTP